VHVNVSMSVSFALFYFTSFYFILFLCNALCMRNFAGTEGGPWFFGYPEIQQTPGGVQNPNPCTTAPALNNCHRLGATRRDMAIHTWFLWPHTIHPYILYMNIVHISRYRYVYICIYANAGHVGLITHIYGLSIR